VSYFLKKLLFHFKIVKNMKQINQLFIFCCISAMFFLSSCRKEDVKISTGTQEETQEFVSDGTLSERAACTIPTNFFTGVDPKAPTTTKPRAFLYQTRLAVAAYRYWRRAYHGVVNGTIKSFTQTEINNAGIQELVGPEITALQRSVSNVINKTYLPNSTAYAEIALFITTIQNMRASGSNNLITKSAMWSSSSVTDVGSYSIIFQSNKVYAGKGPLQRCRESALQRCNDNSMDSPTFGDWEGYDTGLASRNGSQTGRTSADVQAFKEEAMRFIGFKQNAGPLSTNNGYAYYNSPDGRGEDGIRYINADGF
jgi:hypothetical protein